MAVALTVSETLDGAAVSDSLAGGGTGVDVGSVTNGNYTPIILKSANTGKQDIYVRHDAVADPITNFAMFIQAYGVGTGFTYGGADTAANDYSALQSLGTASGTSKNNNDLSSGGFWMDHDWDASTTNQFDTANSTVSVISSTVGKDLATAVTISSNAMVYDAPGETAGSAPVSGSLGKSGDTVLGDNAHLKFRLYLPGSHTTGGILQWETVFSYSFTS